MEFNETKDGPDETATTNYEGGEAFVPDDPKLHLYKLTINNLLEDTFYREDEQALREVRGAFDAVADEAPAFPLKLAQYAREEMYLRDISQVLLVLAANDERTQPFVRDYATGIIQRADEPATALAIHDTVFGGTAPKPLKAGINDALHEFDTYQFAKYDTDRREVNLRDVLNRTHPKPRDQKHDEIFERLIRGPLDDYPEVHPLDTPETWETVISARGNTQEAWERVLPRMGMFARLRNLRNMLEAGVDAETILNTPRKGKDYETGEVYTISEHGLTIESVRHSKLYPFRFYQAYLALEDAGLNGTPLDVFLEEAVNVGAEALDDTFGNSVVGVDVSGSMRYPLSARSAVEYIDIAALFGGVFGTKGAKTYGFATKYQRVDAHPSTPAIEYARKFKEHRWGESTHANKLMRHLVETETAVGQVVLLTDGQVYKPRGRDDSFRDEWLRYKEHVAPEASIYIMDLSSYGDLVVPEGQPDAYQVNGWNDNILDFIQHADDPGDLLAEIEASEPPE